MFQEVSLFSKIDKSIVHSETLIVPSINQSTSKRRSVVERGELRDPRGEAVEQTDGSGGFPNASIVSESRAIANAIPERFTMPHAAANAGGGLNCRVNRTTKLSVRPPRIRPRRRSPPPRSGRSPRRRPRRRSGGGLVV
jgi:hypothetical protein